MSNFAERIIRFNAETTFKNLRLPQAIEALTIANSTLIFGLFLLQFIRPGELLFPLFSTDLDIGLVSILILWAYVIVDPAGLGLLTLGWVLAGIYTRRKYGDSNAGILIRGSAIPAGFLGFAIGPILLSLGLIPGIGLLVGLELFIIIGVLFIFSAVFTIAGIIVSQFFSFNSSYKYIHALEPDYLVLNVLPQGEEESHCPFRSDLPGCSYLGYKAPDRPLICDFESTYLRCRVYSHIYEQHLEAEP